MSPPAHLHSSKLSAQWLWPWICVQTTGFGICFWCPWDVNTGIPQGLWPRLVMPFAARRQPWTIFHTIPSHPLLARGVVIPLIPLFYFSLVPINEPWCLILGNQDIRSLRIWWPRGMTTKRWLGGNMFIYYIFASLHKLQTHLCDA